MNLPYYEISRDVSDKLLIRESATADFDCHFHKKLEIYYILSGQFNITINGVDYSFLQDEIAFVPQFYVHGGNPSNTSKEFTLIPTHELTGDISALFKNTTLPCKMSDTSFNKSAIFPIIYALKKDPSCNKDVVMKGYLNIIFGNLYYHYNTVEIQTGENIEFIVSVLKYIDDNFKKKLDLEFLSSLFGYNKFYFSRQFNKIVKMNINEYINYVRLQKFSAIYASNEKIRITELAFDCGFDSLATFYRSFMRIYNKKPKQVFKEI